MANDPPSESGGADEAAEPPADAAGSGEDLLDELLVGSDDDGSPLAASLVAHLEALEASVADLDDALEEQIQDVRERVIQVKREVDAKAAADHDHADLEAGLGRIEDELESVGADVDSLGDDLERVDDRMARGFSNYEDVLEHLIDATDDLNGKVDTLARATLRLRERAGRLAAAEAERAAADALRETAQVHGVTEAKCEDCGETVQLGLLTGPDCPHCESPFARLDPNRGFFRTSVLRTGRRPALEGEVDREGPDLDAIVGADVEAPPEVDQVASIDDRPDDGVDRVQSPERNVADRGVEEVPGIGPAYAERLRSAGVSTIGGLAEADPSRLAEAVDVAPARVEKWVRRARDVVEAA